MIAAAVGGAGSQSFNSLLACWPVVAVAAESIAYLHRSYIIYKSDNKLYNRLKRYYEAVVVTRRQMEQRKRDRQTHKLAPNWANLRRIGRRYQNSLPPPLANLPSICAQ